MHWATRTPSPNLQRAVHKDAGAAVVEAMGGEGVGNRGRVPLDLVVPQEAEDSFDPVFLGT